VASFGDNHGPSSLANRIAAQSQQIPSLKRPGLTLSVSYSMLAPIPTGIEAAAGEAVAVMANRLDQAITTAISAPPFAGVERRRRGVQNSIPGSLP
jgi:hypothetical protein